MNLSEQNKLANFCHSCKNREVKESGKLICRLSGSVPHFHRTCKQHTYDPGLDVVLKKHLLENRYKKKYLTDLFDSDYTESLKNIRLDSKEVLKYGRLSKGAAIVLYSLLSAFGLWLVFKNEEFNTLSVLFIAVVVGFALELRKRFKYNKEISIDLDGIESDSFQFLWEFVAGIYLYTDYDLEGVVNEEYLILLHSSGKEYKMDIKLMSLSEKELKRIINTYWYLGFYQKKSVYNTMYKA